MNYFPKMTDKQRAPIPRLERITSEMTMTLAEVETVKIHGIGVIDWTASKGMRITYNAADKTLIIEKAE